MAGEGLETGVLTAVGLPVALAITMFGMGMGLSGADFRRLRDAPEAVLLGLGTQALLLPAVGTLVALAFVNFAGLPTELAIGLILLACCPGGTTSNIVTYLARADAALSVTVTSFSSLLSPIVTPLTFLAGVSLLGAGARSVSVSIAEMAGLTAAIVLLPIALGMIVRRARPALADRAERPFRIASVVILALVIAGVIAQNRVGFWSLAARVAPVILVLNLAALATGLLVGRLARLGASRERALSIEVGFQNGTLGIALAVTQLGSSEAAIVPAFYGLLMFLTGGALAWWWAGDAARRGFGATAAREAPLEPVAVEARAPRAAAGGGAVSRSRIAVGRPCGRRARNGGGPRGA